MRTHLFAIGAADMCELLDIIGREIVVDTELLQQCDAMVIRPLPCLEYFECVGIGGMIDGQIYFWIGLFQALIQ